MANPFEIAGALGASFCDDFGKFVMEEIELAYASKLSGQFADADTLRAWQNLNLYWKQSWWKGLFLEVFAKCIPEQSFINMTSGTTETLFGSIFEDGSQLIEPAFLHRSFVFIPELETFLTTENFVERVKILNEALEGRETTRGLLKFAKASEELRATYVKGASKVWFIDRTHIGYKPETCFIIATHPLEVKKWTYLKSTGFWSRFHTLQMEISRGFHKQLMVGKNRSFDKSLMEELRKVNLEMFEHAPFARNRPKNEIMIPVMTELYRLTEEKSEAFKNLDITDILNSRIRGNVEREINAYQILSGANDADATKWVMERLDHFIAFDLEPLMSWNSTVRVKDTACGDALLAFLSDHREHETSEIQRELQKKGFKEGNVKYHLTYLSSLGKIRSDKRGFWKVSD